MRFAPEGRPFIAGALALAAAGWSAVAWLGGPLATTVAAGLTLLVLFVAYFFRDPVRPVPSDPGLVLAPADGRVVGVSEVDEPVLFDGPCRRISIFLSVFDVHVQRAPVSGEVAHRSYRPGGYAIAWKPKASEENEQASLGIQSPRGPVVVRQIAGLVARRIVTDPEVGEAVERGQRIGLIRFGSRVDTFLPLEWDVACSEGDVARSSTTVLARIPDSDGGEGTEGAGPSGSDAPDQNRGGGPS